MNIPTDVAGIISKLNNNGFEAYAVGGCVRDSLMGKTPVDWDVTTSALPHEVKSLFPRTHDTGIAHGTVTVVVNKRNYEVTTYRIDGEYTDNRRPAQISFTGSIQEDLLRRDFTMNAICYHEDSGYLDPCGGIADIAGKLVRGVGEPDRRFGEDALRMLRALRFAAQLDFEIEEKTWASLLSNAALIKNISLERIRDELLKLLLSDHPEKISLLHSSGLMQHIDPALAEHIKTVDPKTFKNLDKDICIRLVVLLRGCCGTKARLKYFKLDNKSINLITTLLTEIETPVAADFIHIRQRLSLIGIDSFLKLLHLVEAYGGDMSAQREMLDIILTQGHCIRLSDLAINGDDLKAMGITNGMEIGRVLKLLFAHVLEYPKDNNSDVLKNLLNLKT